MELKRLLGIIYTLDYLTCPLESTQSSVFRVSVRLATLDLAGASVAEISEVVIIQSSHNRNSKRVSEQTLQTVSKSLDLLFSSNKSRRQYLFRAQNIRNKAFSYLNQPYHNSGDNVTKVHEMSIYAP